MMIVNRGNGGRHLQVRRPSKNGWTVAKRAAFLDALAITCNAGLAAERAGVSVAGARTLRRRDGEFARLWAEALEQGAERLEEMLLAHALGQAPTGDNPSGDRAEAAPALPFDPKAAMDVLRYRQATQPRAQSQARRMKKGPTQDEVDEALMARLDALARRLGNDA